jgi:hypothetical protein
MPSENDLTRKSPQEKKQLSFAKDRRNTYGNSDKAARKAIPLRKAIENRKNRHKNNQAVAMIPSLDDAHAELVESSARQDVYRAGGWTKSADTPLGEYVKNGLEYRNWKIGWNSRKPGSSKG